MKQLSTLILLLVLLNSCGTESDNSTNNVIIQETQHCDNCETDKFIIQKTDSTHRKSSLINESIAIEFFNLYKTIIKYDVKFQDSLPEKVKYDNRQTIYRSHDTYGIYHAILKPVLDSLKVKIVAGNFQDSTLTFSINNKFYNVDVSRFKENDGIIFFKPGKQPILWTLDCMNKRCAERDFVKCYFEM